MNSFGIHVDVNWQLDYVFKYTNVRIMFPYILCGEKNKLLRRTPKKCHSNRL